jgi:hypothetical protein
MKEKIYAVSGVMTNYRSSLNDEGEIRFASAPAVAPIVSAGGHCCDGADFARVRPEPFFKGTDRA